MKKLERFLYIFGVSNVVLQIMFFFGNLPSPFIWWSNQGQTVIFTMSIIFAFLFVNSR
tara:strand:- start:212 stop:385 length:174 start_codon:yes stop_codon:yes gene_type:complete